MANNTIVSDVKARAVFNFAEHGVCLDFLKALLPFTQHILTLALPMEKQ